MSSSGTGSWIWPRACCSRRSRRNDPRRRHDLLLVWRHPALHQPHVGDTWSAPSMAMSSRLSSSNERTSRPIWRACSSVATDVATYTTARPRRAMPRGVGNGRPGAEPDGHAVFDKVRRRLRSQALLLLGVATVAKDSPCSCKRLRANALGRWQALFALGALPIGNSPPYPLALVLLLVEKVALTKLLAYWAPSMLLLQPEMEMATTRWALPLFFLYEEPRRITITSCGHSGKTSLTTLPTQVNRQVIS